MSTRGQGHCFTFVQGHSDLYSQTFALKLLDTSMSNFMWHLYDLGNIIKVCSNDVGHMTKMGIMPIYGFKSSLKYLSHRHTCHKLWTKICEIRKKFKGDLIKFCESFTKITLELPQNSQKPLFRCKKLIKNTTKCDLCLFLHEMCC